jgi:hypothetical protein
LSWRSYSATVKSSPPPSSRSASVTGPVDGTPRATIDARRWSSSSSPRSMWLRIVTAAGTNKASTAAAVIATIVTRMRRRNAQTPQGSIGWRRSRR